MGGFPKSGYLIGVLIIRESYYFGGSLIFVKPHIGNTDDEGARKEAEHKSCRS